MNELTVKQLAEQINEEHERASGAIRDALTHAITCGELLTQAKAGLKHGEWGKWILDNCHFSDRSARLYMHLAENRAELEKTATIADLTLNSAAGLLAEPHTYSNDEILQTVNIALAAAEKELNRPDLTGPEAIALAKAAGRLSQACNVFYLRLARKAGAALNELQKQNEPLTPEEQQALERCEAIIEPGIKTYGDVLQAAGQIIKEYERAGLVTLTTTGAEFSESMTFEQWKQFGGALKVYGNGVKP